MKAYVESNLQSPLSMLIQRNEGKACDAVVRHIEACTGDTRKSLRHPETDHEGPPVDLRLKVGAQEYAIEHTLLQMYPNMIKYVGAFNTIHKFVGKRISGPLPGAVHYELHVPIKVSFPRGKKHRERALHSLVEWILSSARSDCTSDVGKYPLRSCGSITASGPYPTDLSTSSNYFAGQTGSVRNENREP